MSGVTKQLDRSVLLLVMGAVAGAALAAAGVVGTGRSGASDEVPPGAVAVVNGRQILKSDYERALRALAADRRNGKLDDALRQRVLDRLVEQELLIQRGLELDLPQQDPRIRATLSDAVIGLLVAKAERRPPAAAELQALYEQEAERFGRPERIRARQIFFSARSPAGLQRAQRAHRRLAGGESYETVLPAGDETAAPLPDGLLPVAKLRDYLGPTIAGAAAELAVGQVSAVLQSPAGFHIVQVTDREPGGKRPFAEVEQLVVAEHTRRCGDRALRSFLDQRRATAAITIARERL